MVGEYHIEVAFNQVQTFNHTVRFKQMSLWKDQHHESGEKFLVFNEFHVALCHLCAEVSYFTAIHLSEKY